MATEQRIRRLNNSPAICSPKIHDLCPKLRGLDHHGFVVSAGEFPKMFRAIVTCVKAACEFFRDNAVLARNQHGDWAAIIAEIILRRKAVHEEQASREEKHMMLGDVGQPIVWREQNHA